MATPYGIDYGNVLNIKRAGEQHQMQKQRFQQEQEERESARARNVFMQSARAAAVNREPGAMAQLVTLDPQQAQQISQYLSSAEEDERKRLEEQNDLAGRMAAVVLSSQNPEQSYATYRNSLPEPMKAAMPEDYDETFMRFQLARAQEVSEIMKNPEVKSFGGEDIMMQGGRVIGRTASQNALNQANRAAAPELNASDENAMFRQSVELLGGLFDASGNIQALDPQLRGRAQAIATEASRLFREGGMTRSQAVTSAAQALGVSVPSIQSRTPLAGEMTTQRPPQTRQPSAPPAAIARPQQFTEQNPAQPATVDEYNALPSGAVFRDPQDGQLYRKP